MNVHPSVEEAIDQIDAAIFTGDAFLDKPNRDEMREMVARWQRQLDSLAEIFDEFDEGEPEEDE